MAKLAVYKVTYSLQNSSGKAIGGPYTTTVAIADPGDGVDQMTQAIATSLTTVISSNLLSIHQSFNQSPGGKGDQAKPTDTPHATVVIESYSRASVPACWT